MSKRYDCRDPQERIAGIEAAVTAARAGELIVLPTDTVYGIGADAFTPAAVTTMLAAKGRGRNMPPPVLVGTARAAAALVDDLGAFGQDLIDEFWPGALTLVFRASPTLLWDLGDTKGTVALRMPLHSVALDVLKQTGPLAVSSANRHGQPSAINADQAEQQLGEAVSIYLDAGPCADNVPSTILDLTGVIEGPPRRRDPRGPAAHGGLGHRRRRALRGGRGTRSRLQARGAASARGLGRGNRPRDR